MMTKMIQRKKAAPLRKKKTSANVLASKKSPRGASSKSKISKVNKMIKLAKQKKARKTMATAQRKKKRR
ncbi:hypothetical protein HY496_01560 [Candidatus Woesearchaeota archaeon]|nr:hypothetical protein [Candidatus Woesearchaeota archaeon]